MAIFDEVQKSKETIAAYMGHNFVDAIYEGTTSETLTIGFEKAMKRIAVHCEKNLGITPIWAVHILREENPERQYYPLSFYKMLGFDGIPQK